MSRLEAFQRRQALSMHGEAADLTDDVGASMLSACPPHPPITKAPPTWGKPCEGRGPGDRFSRWIDSGSRVEGSNPGIATVFDCAFLYFSPVSAVLACFSFPRITSLFPRNGLFLPRVAFLVPRLFFPLSSFVEREREREEGKNAKSGNPRIRFVTRGYKTYGLWKKQAFPRIAGDAFLSNLQCWRGFTCGLSPIPVFFTRNAPPSPAGAVSGGGHGGR